MWLSIEGQFKQALSPNLIHKSKQISGPLFEIAKSEDIKKLLSSINIYTNILPDGFNKCLKKIKLWSLAPLSIIFLKLVLFTHRFS